MDGRPGSLRTADHRAPQSIRADMASVLRHWGRVDIAGAHTVESLIGLGNLSDNDKSQAGSEQTSYSQNQWNKLPWHIRRSTVGTQQNREAADAFVQ